MKHRLPWRLRFSPCLFVLIGLSGLLVFAPFALAACGAAGTTAQHGFSSSLPQSTLNTTTSATETTTTTEVPRSIDEQWERFAAVSNLAQHYGWAAIDYKAPQSPDWNAELITYGAVVKVDPARWNTPDGRQPAHARQSADDNPVIYTTFYVQPTEIRGTPRFGTPIAIMVPYHDELLAEGDEVLVFAEYGEMWGPGTWKQDAYFSVEEVRGIYMKVGEQYLNIDSGQPLASAETSDQEGTARAEETLREFFHAWAAKDVATWKALLSESRQQNMNLGDWTFAGLDRVEFGTVVTTPDPIDPWLRGGNRGVTSDDVRCFRASVTFYYKPGVVGPNDSGEEYPWMWFVIRDADGHWGVSDWGA